MSAFVDTGITAGVFAITSEQDQLFKGLEATACVERPQGKAPNGTVVRDLKRTQGCAGATGASSMAASSNSTFEGRRR